jgi:hypothetical protein
VKNVQYDRLRDGAGKAPGVLGWWPEKAVTFVDNHDTGSSQAVRRTLHAIAALAGWSRLSVPRQRRDGHVGSSTPR